MSRRSGLSAEGIHQWEQARVVCRECQGEALETHVL